MNRLSEFRSSTQNYVCKPIFFDIKLDEDKKRLEDLLESNRSIVVIDEILGQLEELLKLKYPSKKNTKEELTELIALHLDTVPVQEYGVWVYYPWLNMLIHLLGESEYVEVRTNRNHYKITPEEEQILAIKKIGIIGLSVGKAIALTMATERICGELVLADFDVIELSNLNRIQTGVQNFGTKKTVVVAREIAELDPYLKVTCFHEGLTEENFDDFFTQNGKMDLCVEVCDGLVSKIVARQKAKSLRIPVVMNSSDRGSTDVERFDLDGDLPILHGLVDHLDLSKVKEAKTNEEKIPYLLPMLGIETSSERLKASMLEIEGSITTWPQLASGVVLGGAICTDVSRRLLLGRFTNSGRYFIDIEEQIDDSVQESISAQKIKEERITCLPKTKLSDYDAVLEEAGRKLFKEVGSGVCSLLDKEVKALVEYAIMAPSGGNVQPWKWLYKNNKLMLFNDVHRSSSILNHNNAASLLSFGAASENLIIKAHKMGYEVELDKFPLGVGNQLISTFCFTKNKMGTSQEHTNDDLYDEIPKRCTNRVLNKRAVLKPESLDYLNEVIATVEGASLKVFSEEADIEALKDILAEVDKLFMTNKKGHSHFIKEIRWTKKEVVETRDGIDINTIDLTPAERAGLLISKNWNVTKHLKKWKLGSEFGKLSKKAVDASAALGMVTMPKSDRVDYFDGGRAVQKLWLACTKEGIAFQPMSISTFLFAKVAEDSSEDIEDIIDDLKVLYRKLIQICRVEKTEKDVFFFRMGIAKEPKVKALRRDVKDVLMYE